MLCCSAALVLTGIHGRLEARGRSDINRLYDALDSRHFTKGPRPCSK